MRSPSRLISALPWLLLIATINPLASAKQNEQLQITSGDQQRVIIGQTVGTPLTVTIHNAAGQPLPGLKVRFTTTIGATVPMSFETISDLNGTVRYQPKAIDFGAIHIKAQLDTSDSGWSKEFQLVGTGWISTIAGEGFAAWGGDHGPATQAQMNAPFGLMVRDQELFVVDYFNHALRTIDLQTGIIRPLVGTGKSGFNGDGLAPLETLVNGPFGQAFGPNNVLIFADYYNNRIRQWDPKSNRVTTLAGIGTPGYSGDGGPGTAAAIDVPLDIATDFEGNVYLSDWHHHVVRKWEAKTGTITTVAGIGYPGYTGEGPGNSTALSTPLGLETDKAGNLYIADYANSRIRKLDRLTGTLSTVVGTGQRGFSGDGGIATDARIDRPYDLYIDDKGAMFISDAGNHRIRHVEPKSGIITSIAGSGQIGSISHSATTNSRAKTSSANNSSDLATKADLYGPFSVTRDNAGNLYIAEYFGHRIRKVGSQPAEKPAPEDPTQKLRRQAKQLFGKLPKDASRPDRPLSPEKVRLGKKLFHDRRLSADNTISCATCHSLETFGIDGQALSKGINNQINDRNAPSVFNAALQDSQFWDGRTIDVEAQAIEPILDPKEMGMLDEESVLTRLRAIPEYQPLFAAAFPNQAQPLVFKNIGIAIGAFERTLLTPDAPIDRFIAGDDQALSEQQLAGLSVYLREGCASCHAGPLMGGQEIHLIENYPNTPAGDQFEFRKRLGNSHKFKVSPLRNITVTPPYLHDGRYPTLKSALEDRLIAYLVREAGIHDSVVLAPGELDAMISFLQSLTGQFERSPDKTPPQPTP